MFIIKEKHKNATIPVSIRFNDDLHAKLKEYGKKHKISFNELVLQCCEYALNNIKHEKN